MVYSFLFLLLFLAVSTAMVVVDCPNQLRGSGLPDLQQVTMLPYCVIDECTIGSLESEEQLYSWTSSTQPILFLSSLQKVTKLPLLVTTKGYQTAMGIARTKEHVQCINSTVRAIQLVVPSIVRLLLGLVVRCIIATYLVYMGTAFGLLMGDLLSFNI